MKRAYRPTNARNQAHKVKLAALAIYSAGTMTCAVCGFADIRALSIDHIANDGYKEHKNSRGGNNLAWKLKREDYPPGFQVLCLNCNWIKEHERRQREGRSHK